MQGYAEAFECFVIHAKFSLSGAPLPGSPSTPAERRTEETFVTLAKWFFDAFLGRTSCVNLNFIYESAHSAVHFSPISKTPDSLESARSIVSRKKREGPSPSRRPWSARWKKFWAVSRSPFS